MTLHFFRSIEKLKERIINLSARVEEDLHKAVNALLNRDSELAQQVIDMDEKIDSMEVDIEEECLKNLALHQPVARDLRFLVAVLKINNDIERIGDLSVNIAETAISLNLRKKVEPPFDLRKMVDLVKSMVKKSLDALLQEDAELAREVLAADEDVDEIHKNAYPIVTKHILEQPEVADTYIRMLSVSRYLERVADYATNIAEDVIYMVEGSIVRHTSNACEKDS
jgi:phosphate transport system protein